MEQPYDEQLLMDHVELESGVPSRTERGEVQRNTAVHVTDEEEEHTTEDADGNEVELRTVERRRRSRSPR